MTLPLELGKKSARGSFNLFLGVVGQNVLLAIGTIIVGRLLGSAYYGLYTISMVPANFIGLFVGLGVRQATTRYTAQYDHTNQKKKVGETIITGLLFTALFGTILTILCFLLADPIAGLFGRPNAGFLVQIISSTIFCNAMIVTSQSFFIGLERTGFYSILIIFRGTLQAILEPLLILMLWSPSAFGPLGAVVGYAIVSITTCAVALSITNFALIRPLKPYIGNSYLTQNLRTMLRYGIPLYVRRVLGGFQTQFSSLLMVIYVSNALIGNYKVSSNFMVLIGFIAVPIGTVLFPAFSKMRFEQDAEALQKVFKTSVKYTALLITPATTLVIILSNPLVTTLYGTTYEYAPFFLSLSSLIYVYVSVGQLSIDSILQGQGETKRNMILGLANVAVGIPLAIVLVPRLQIIGLIVTTIISSFPQVVLGLFWVKKLYKISIDWIVAAKIFILSLTAGLMTHAAINLFSLPSWMQLLVGIVLLTIISLVLLPLLRIVKSDDITNLRTIFSETGPAYTILYIPLKFMEKLCR